ncbi:hypothetical protein JCGZ_20115 [Jatropha curcas]|uniref:G-patch domain-containing protein n=1 Tax=Jatropha curcas TaxID=180498 RepID=A0A067JXL3_JATCU|nr:hypothetical protein JCGZ_20115 [Jatropha curcas]
MMKKMQWKYGKGLGRDLQGRFEPVPSSHGQQGRRGLGYSESRKKEKYEVQSLMKEPGLNKIFFVPEASGEFQSRGKTYPGLEIFIMDFDEQLIKSPEPSFEQLVDSSWLAWFKQAVALNGHRRYLNLKISWDWG